MSSLNLTDIKSLQSQFNQLSGLGVDILGSNDATKFTGTIWDGMQGIATLVDKNTSSEKKQKVLINLFKEILDKGVEELKDLISGLGKNETRNSKKEVDGIAKEAEKLNAESQKLGIDIEGNFRQIANDIEDNTDIVEEAQEQLETVQEEIEAEEKKIKETVVEIQKQQRLLASPELTKEDKLEILNIIQGLTGDLTASTEIIISKQEILSNLGSAVKNATDNIAVAEETLEQKVLEAQAEIQEKANEGAELTGDAVQSATKGFINEKQALLLHGLAGAAATNVVTVATAAELEETALDQDGAAVTRIGGANKNTTKISEVVNSLGEDNRIVARYENTVGSALTNFISQVGSWNSALSPMITSIGSATLFAQENEQLISNIDEDIKVVESQETLAKDASPVDEDNANLDDETLAPETSLEDSLGGLENGLKTPKFKFTQSFGI
ncbi:hypothetical protein IKB17_05730 [bacterium]|nr:hypothetical protein [bacterium]